MNRAIAVLLLFIIATIAAQSAIAQEVIDDEIMDIGCNIGTVAFETGLPTSWSSSDTSIISWGNIEDCHGIVLPPFENWTGGSGNAMCVESDSYRFIAYDARMVSNAVAIPADTTSAILTYKTNYQDVTFDDNRDYFDLDISTDNGGSWTNLLHWIDDHGAQGDLPGETVSVDLSAYAGQTVLVRWRFYDLLREAWDWYAQVDDVSLACDQGVDYSDLTPTITGAAWHSNPSPRTLWLGPLVDDDPNDLDNTDFNSDDGVIITNSWESEGTALLRIVVSGNPGWVAGWVDWDNSGTFENPAELVLDQAVSTGLNSVSFPIPSEYLNGSAVRSRFRLYPSEPSAANINSLASPTGAASDGEVEDYTWSFTATAVELTQISVVSRPPWLTAALGLAAILILILIPIVRRNNNR